MHPFLDIAFFIYRYDKDREQRIEGGSNKIGDYVDFMYVQKVTSSTRYLPDTLQGVQKAYACCKSVSSHGVSVYS